MRPKMTKIQRKAWSGTNDKEELKRELTDGVGRDKGRTARGCRDYLT
jgi:hypothetical protein